ncbi:probable inactive ATP-dependent zinc metalloprotease FTSHI 1, chloroplastic isoform X3 [Gossypium arboreum]|uniref:probable inactive ATP-dependent zinc metalloprotease FTSHI 1, chloroplastic isoform X3 n=1 Tax=Gossypium arboreum TaxID=29729 RepID=UPI000818FBC7|nr:probable inactive ATP-dependent zinc metalloprotease FTSHI 1, chloroplastic isoform X3 [Gossypium arboreum]XP_017626646.1 probable inactive ATP-dependent zinc metalloprotease FTSHI 1, chloroplastic isoform X3 [Gossypium arboreum]
MLPLQVNKPLVIFIDEIDTLATRHQGIFKETTDHLYNAATQERETTLNQLLIELDGFDTDKDSALDIDEQISQLMQCQSIMQQGIKYTSQRLDIFACVRQNG